jgi:hypothetical protein
VGEARVSSRTHTNASRNCASPSIASRDDALASGAQFHPGSGESAGRDDSSHEVWRHGRGEAPIALLCSRFVRGQAPVVPAKTLTAVSVMSARFALGRHHGRTAMPWTAHPLQLPTFLTRATTQTPWTLAQPCCPVGHSPRLALDPVGTCQVERQPDQSNLSTPARRRAAHCHTDLLVRAHRETVPVGCAERARPKWTRET